MCEQVLTLELTGELFVGDASKKKRQNLSYQEHLNNALEYWSTATCDMPEYLFYGEAKAIDVENIAQ